jgi:uncharacterized Tic20 family protein
MVSALISLLIVILIVGLIAGLVVWLIRKAPFIPGEFKTWAEYLVIVIAVLVIVLRALPLVGVAV